jgi:hypothetical protein
LTPLGGRPALRNWSRPMDFIFLAVGVGLFAAFALYAVLLRRV